MYIEQLDKQDFIKLAHHVNMELESVAIIYDKVNPRATANIFNSVLVTISVEFTDFECKVYGYPKIQRELSRTYYEYMLLKFGEEYFEAYNDQFKGTELL